VGVLILRAPPEYVDGFCDATAWALWVKVASDELM
jgi:hypothetical protein